MFNESRSPAYDKEMSSRLLTDATIMGSTPRLNLEKVYDDPFLIKAKENQIIALSDQITQINRENATEAYHLTLKHQLIKLRNKKLRKRDAQLKKRDAASRSYETELAQALEQKKKAEDKMKISKINFEKVKGLYDEMLNEFGDFVKNEDDKTADANQLELLEAFTPDFSKEGEEQADMEERIYLISQIKEKERDVAKLKHAYRHAQFQEFAYDGEFAKINCTRDSLMIEAEHFQQKLDKLNKRFDVASKKKSKPYDPVHFEDGLIEQTEKTADELEKRLTRSRVDAIEYDLQHEYSSYQALKNENKQRKYEIQIRRNELQKAKLKQKKRSKIIQQMTPRSKDYNTETNISLNSSTGVGISKTRNTFYQMKQDEIDRLNAETEEIDKQNKESRADVEKDYYETMQKVLDLNTKLLESEENYIQFCNYSSEVDKARLQENDLSMKIKKIEAEKQALIKKVENLPKYKPPQSKVDRLNKIQEETNAKEDKLKAWRDRVAKKKAEVDELQGLVDEALSRHDELNKHINQIISNMESNINDIEYLSNNMSIIRLTAQKEQILEEEEEEINQYPEIIQEEEEIGSLTKADDQNKLEILQEEEELNLEEEQQKELSINQNNEEENQFEFENPVDEAGNQQAEELDQMVEIISNKEEEEQIIIQTNEEEEQIIIQANEEEVNQQNETENLQEEGQIYQIGEEIETYQEEEQNYQQQEEQNYQQEEEQNYQQQEEQNYQQEEEQNNQQQEEQNNQEEEQNSQQAEEEINIQIEPEDQEEEQQNEILIQQDQELPIHQTEEEETKYENENQQEEVIIQQTGEEINQNNGLLNNEEEETNQQIEINNNDEEEQNIHQTEEEEINQNTEIEYSHIEEEDHNQPDETPEIEDTNQPENEDF